MSTISTYLVSPPGGPSFLMSGTLDNKHAVTGNNPVEADIKRQNHRNNKIQKLRRLKFIHNREFQTLHKKYHNERYVIHNSPHRGKCNMFINLKQRKKNAVQQLKHRQHLERQNVQ